MKLKLLFTLLLTTLAFSVTACDSDDENTTPQQSGKFKVPDYKEGNECFYKLTKSFCDGNYLVRCQNDGHLKKIDCSHVEGNAAGVCLWSPDLENLEDSVLHGEAFAYCLPKNELENNQIEEFQKCTEVGKITTVCQDDEETGSFITYYKCLDSTQGLYSRYYNYKECSGKCSDDTSCAQ